MQNKKFYVVAHCANGDLVISTTGGEKYFTSREAAEEVLNDFAFMGGSVKIEIVEL